MCPASVASNNYNLCIIIYPFSILPFRKRICKCYEATNIDSQKYLIRQINKKKYLKSKSIKLSQIQVVRIYRSYIKTSNPVIQIIQVSNLIPLECTLSRYSTYPKRRARRMINHHFHAKEVDEKQLGKSRNGYVRVMCQEDRGNGRYMQGYLVMGKGVL